MPTAPPACSAVAETPDACPCTPRGTESRLTGVVGDQDHREVDPVQHEAGQQRQVLAQRTPSIGGKRRAQCQGHASYRGDGEGCYQRGSTANPVQPPTGKGGDHHHGQRGQDQGQAGDYWARAHSRTNRQFTAAVNPPPMVGPSAPAIAATPPISPRVRPRCASAMQALPAPRPGQPAALRPGGESRSSISAWSSARVISRGCGRPGLFREHQALLAPTVRPSESDRSSDLDQPDERPDQCELREPKAAPGETMA
jgi:hypothetical protein